jgi:hypothetical protein
MKELVLLHVQVVFTFWSPVQLNVQCPRHGRKVHLWTLWERLELHVQCFVKFQFVSRF